MGVLSKSWADAEDARKTPQANKVNITRKATVRKPGLGTLFNSFTRSAVRSPAIEGGLGDHGSG
jgi:hypothetical protein